MPLKNSIRLIIENNLEKYEGRHNHMYLDSVGHVTIGVGHLLPDPTALTHIKLYTITNHSIWIEATPKKKQEEFSKIRKLSKGYKASWYKSSTNLVMKEYDITTLRNKHIDVFYRELSSTFSQNSGCLNEFDDLPDNVQLALFDMIFNLGQTRLRNIFRKFTLAIYNENWSDAATESYRPQVNRQRNDYVKELLLNVKKNQQAFPAQTER